MSETLLALMSALAIYGLSSFAMPVRDLDPTDDDGWSEKVGEVAPKAGDDTSLKS